MATPRTLAVLLARRNDVAVATRVLGNITVQDTRTIKRSRLEMDLMADELLRLETRVLQTTHQCGLETTCTLHATACSALNLGMPRHMVLGQIT